LPTFTDRSLRALLPAVVVAAICLLASSCVAQSVDDSGSAALFTPYNTATTGCGDATNIGSSNEAPVYVDGFPCQPSVYPSWNEPYTNIKICEPGSTTNCQVIDHVIVDSGSDGLRFMEGVIKSSLLTHLPAMTVKGKTITECETYVDSYTYGPLLYADLYFGGKVVKKFPLQLATNAFTPPTDCSDQGGEKTNTPALFGGNGLVGVAFPLTDMTPYYACQSNGPDCKASDYAGLPNLVSVFEKDNNGAVITLPAISAQGAGTPVLGSLIFGVGTESNNKPPTGTKALKNDLAYGEFNVELGSNKAQAYIDSGTSNLVVTGDWAQCSASTGLEGFFCPDDKVTISMGLSSIGSTKPAYDIGLIIENANSLLDEGDVAYDDIAEYVSSSASAGGDYALGLTAFFGRTMYFVFNGRSSDLGTGPINAMSPQR
jgi:hypothetical protein